MEIVDWDLAVSTARKLVRPGPELTPDEATEVVRELRSLADEALTHVVAYTGLTPQSTVKTTTEVVDRATWAAYNVGGMRRTLSPFLHRLADRRGQRVDAQISSRPAFLAGMSAKASGATLRAGQAAAGVELGS